LARLNSLLNMTNIEAVTKFKFASLGIVVFSYTVALAYYIYIGW